MSRTRIVAAIVGVVIVLVLIGAAYIWVSGGSATPSAPLSAPTLAIAQVSTSAPSVAVTSDVTSQATVAATAAVTPETTAAATAAASAAQSNLVVFAIAPDQSQVSFTLNEVLRGSNNKVVGKTNQVAGQIAVDFGSPQNSQVGELRIDARSLATDDEMRNRMIRGQILQSSQDQYEFISFKPTAITGLPASITLGQPIKFQIAGDLTIRDVTKPVTFDAAVTPDSQTKIEGTATTTVQRSDFNLNIPNVPMVTSADEAVLLEIDFVATPAS